MIAKDLFGRDVDVGDLVVWGHAGRYAGTRIGRVYQVDNSRTVRARIVDRDRIKHAWVKGHHSKPHGFVKVDDTGLDVPRLEDL